MVCHHQRKTTTQGYILNQVKDDYRKLGQRLTTGIFRLMVIGLTPIIVVTIIEMLGEWIGTVVVSSITGFITYFLGRRRERKELDNLTLLNLEKSVSIYQIIIDDLKKEVQQLNDKIDKLEAKVEELLKENTELKALMKKHDKTL